MAGGVEKEDAPIAALDEARPKVLRDSATLTRGNGGLAQGVEEARLAVVHMSHDGDDGRACVKRCGGRFLEEDLLGRCCRSLWHLSRHLFDLFRLWFCHVESEFRCDE